MNASEREITGVEDMSGLGSIRDAIMAQAITLAAMSGREAEREKARNEARADDKSRWAHMEENVGKLFVVTDSIKEKLSEIPESIDQRVAVALEGRAVQVDSRKRLIVTMLIVVGILVALAVAAGLEYLSHENAAGRVSLILMPLVTLAGWYVSARRK